VNVEISSITSVFAISISTLTLGWTIYRDAIRKPRLRVSINIKTVLQRGRTDVGPFVWLNVINFGPTPNRAHMIVLRRSWFARTFRKSNTGIVMPDYANPYTTAVGTKLEIGDEANMPLPYDASSFLKDIEFVDVGITDTFGRVHWAPRREFEAVRQTHAEDFPA
jgi:hypothetical protein